jgi:hypothetical protein
LVVIVLLDSSKDLEISDPSISKIGSSGFVELGLAEQIVALHIDQKPKHLI